MVVRANYASFGVFRSLIEVSSACSAFAMGSMGVRRWRSYMQQEQRISRYQIRGFRGTPILARYETSRAEQIQHVHIHQGQYTRFMTQGLN